MLFFTHLQYRSECALEKVQQKDKKISEERLKRATVSEKCDGKVGAATFKVLERRLVAKEFLYPLAVLSEESLEDFLLLHEVFK